jgi:hypothetical protein
MLYKGGSLFPVLGFRSNMRETKPIEQALAFLILHLLTNNGLLFGKSWT